MSNAIYGSSSEFQIPAGDISLHVVPVLFFSFPLPGALNVKTLSQELKSVTDWHQLGIKLGLQHAKLCQIEKEHPRDIERCKVEVVVVWLQSTPGASWRHIVTALTEMGDLSTARIIERKYPQQPHPHNLQSHARKMRIIKRPHLAHSVVSDSRLRVARLGRAPKGARGMTIQCSMPLEYNPDYRGIAFQFRAHNGLN